MTRTGRRVSRAAAAWAVVGAMLTAGVCHGQVPAASDGGIGTAELPAPAALRPQVEFWKAVFTRYSKDEIVLHDPEDLTRVYAVLDLRGAVPEGIDEAARERRSSDAIDAEKQRIRRILLRLAEGQGQSSPLSESEARIRGLFGGAADGQVYREAANLSRIRAQRGIRERFEKGIAVSRRYLPEIERIFREEGVPVAISRLALIESCFDVSAYSKAGAAGVWQFMPATGRLFLRIDDVVDERRDPILAARAAARFLRQNYARLGAWPLAIIAYNHGPVGIERAVGAMGTTDIAEIIARYRGPAFGFASRNFYPEFLAAIEIDARYRDYFGDIRVEPPVSYEWVRLSHYVPLRMVARAAGADVDAILELNPSLSANVRKGTLYVPKGYAVRVPEANAFRKGYAALPASQKLGAQRVLFVMHRVKRGQTLTHLARRYGTSVAAIKSANGMRGSLVRAGQTLRIPKS